VVLHTNNDLSGQWHWHMSVCDQHV